jgi:glutamate formiminotransferase/formiminotetrahydrofolate cyclodeaminase
MMAAMRLPKTTPAEQTARQKAMQDATKAGIEVPLRVMEKSLESMDLMKAMAEIGNPNSVSDAGVGALCARTAVMGAFLNVRINCGGVDDKSWANDVLARGRDMERVANEREREVLAIVSTKLPA